MKTLTTLILLCCLSAGAHDATLYSENWTACETNGHTVYFNRLILAKFSIRLDAATNWTGIQNGTNELGYVVTNHIALVRYEGATNEFTLKSVPTDKAVWRVAPAPSYIMTNQYQQPWWYQSGILTNINVDATITPH